MNALAQELQHACAHAPLEKRVSTGRLALKLEPLPQRECGEKTAVNAKRMLANISPFFLIFFYHRILPFPLSISPDHLLPAVTACGKRPGIV